MGKKKMALFVVLVVGMLSVSWCWGEMNDKAQQAKQSASEAMDDAKEKTGSWANWVSGKFSQ